MKQLPNFVLYQMLKGVQNQINDLTDLYIKQNPPEYPDAFEIIHKIQKRRKEAERKQKNRKKMKKTKKTKK